MLKTRVDDQIWLIPQHLHAQISGYLAAHWGGANHFARPGHYPGATHPAQWRDQVVLAIAEHDNGWWEWEAMPRFNDTDGLPVGLGEVAQPSPDNNFNEWRAGGFDRWRTGINRLAPLHPYAALLISYHAYWLYAVAYDDLLHEADDVFRHAIFGDPKNAANLVGDRPSTRRFLDELIPLQRQLKSRLAQDPAMSTAIDPHHLNPHIRLVQLLDTLSLFLAMNNQQGGTLRDVPRAQWNDRVDIAWRRDDESRILLDPYPFDLDPLPVPMPARTLPATPAAQHHPTQNPLTQLHAIPPAILQFAFASDH